MTYLSPAGGSACEVSGSRVKTELIPSQTQGHWVHKSPLLLALSPLLMVTVPEPVTLGFVLCFPDMLKVSLPFVLFVSLQLGKPRHRLKPLLPHGSFFVIFNFACLP